MSIPETQCEQCETWTDDLQEDHVTGLQICASCWYDHHDDGICTCEDCVAIAYARDMDCAMAEAKEARR